MTMQPTLLDLLAPPASTSGPTSSTRPANWLLEHLIAAGHLTETGLGRRARIRACRCGQLILAGLDDDTCALEAYADPEPLTPLGEMLARLEDRCTWTLRRQAAGWILDIRSHLEIAAKPAGSQPRADIVRQHQCQSRPLADPETAATSFAEARPVTYPPGSPAPF